MENTSLGRFLCADPEVCGGQLGFRGTRILVSDVLEWFAGGMDWDGIIQERDSSIS